MGRGKGLAGAVALSFAAVASSAHAFPFFFVFPIPRGSVDPDKIDASLDQRKLAMCAAYHQNVIDPEVSGKRETTYHGDIVKAVMDRLSTFPNAKKLVGTYIGQWRLQAKQNYQSGQDYARILIEGCNYSNLPVNKLQYDVWKNPSHSNVASQPSVRSVPARPVRLDGVILASDFPANVRRTKPEYVVSTTLQIDRSGKVVDCFIDATSGSEYLDETTCSLLRQRAQFTPAVEDGYVVVSEYKYVHRWDVSQQNTRFNAVTPTTAPAHSVERTSDVQLGAQPAKVVSPQKLSDDAILDTAMNRCDRIGFKRGQDDFKSCVMQQIRLLSERK